MTARTAATAVGVVALEVWLYREYAELGAQFHFWLHGLSGATLGLLALAGWTAARCRPAPVTAWEGGFAGHVVSALPDVLFTALGVLHVSWMDVFALHISLHFVPFPLPTQLGLFLVALATWVLAAEGRRRLALLGGAAVVGVTALGLVLRAPLPASLAEVQTGAAAWLGGGVEVGHPHPAGD